MAITTNQSNESSINEEMNDLRKEKTANVPRSVRKWREKHPNPYRDNESVYSCFSIQKKE